MKYTARTISKNIFNGVLTVEVEFRSEDGKDIFNDKFQTTSAQDETWLSNLVNRKLSDLEGLYPFLETISINTPFTTKAPNSIVIKSSEVNMSSEKRAYKSDLEKFNLWKKAVINGHVDTDNTEFTNLQNKLKKNFKPEYLDLYI